MAIATAKTTTKTDRNEINDFHEQLKAVLPRLRVYALYHEGFWLLFCSRCVGTLQARLPAAFP